MAYNISLLFSGTQVILNFGCALTKPDTRMLIVDLVTFAYCRPQMNEDPEEDLGSTDELGRRRDPFLRTSLAIFRPATRRCSGSTIGASTTMSMRSHRSASMRSLSHSGIIHISQNFRIPRSQSLFGDTEYSEHCEVIEEMNTDDVPSDTSEEFATESDNAMNPSDNGDDSSQVCEDV